MVITASFALSQVNSVLTEDNCVLTVQCICELCTHSVYIFSGQDRDKGSESEEARLH
jgi:hypothetical protein